MDESIKEVASQFRRGKIGFEIRFFEEIDSTNALALRLPSTDIAHGLVLTARSQTAGRGRQGRSWLSLPDIGLHLTAVLIPPDPSRIISCLGLAGALAVYDTLETFCKGRLDIKWPNDVLLNGKKISGILGETASGGKRDDRIALGISINVNHAASDFPEDFRTRSSSILMEEGAAPRLGELLIELLKRLNARYDLLDDSGPAAIVRATSDKSSYVQGKRLRVELPGDREVTGTTAGLNDDGTLQLRLDSGAEISLTAGDVHLM